MKRILFILSINSMLLVTNAQTPAVPDSVAGNAKVTPKEYRSIMREGNKLYESGKLADAETEYKRVLGYEDRANRAAFNLGDALYKQEKYDKAAEQFTEAVAEANEKTDKARAYHNLGNSYLKQNKLEESIGAYKNALRNDPNDADTKYNLSYAMRLLKEQQQQNKDNEDNKDSKDKQDQQNQDQQQDNKDQQDNKEQQQQKDPSQQQQDQQKDEMQQQQQLRQQQINREDAQRMLDAIAQDEKELQEKLQKKERAGYRPQIEKNW